MCLSALYLETSGEALNEAHLVWKVRKRSMAEGAGDTEGLIETYTYSAGSYDRLKSNEGDNKKLTSWLNDMFFVAFC